MAAPALVPCVVQADEAWRQRAHAEANAYRPDDRVALVRVGDADHFSGEQL